MHEILAYHITSKSCLALDLLQLYFDLELNDVWYTSGFCCYTHTTLCSFESFEFEITLMNFIIKKKTVLVELIKTQLWGSGYKSLLCHHLQTSVWLNAPKLCVVVEQQRQNIYANKLRAQIIVLRAGIIKWCTIFCANCNVTDFKHVFAYSQYLIIANCFHSSKW